MKKPFIPQGLPLQKLDWMRFIELIGRANREIARFDGILKAIPNPSILLTPLTYNEAVLSSKIEGTQATLQEVFEFEANMIQNPDKIPDVQEVVNYRKAMSYAIKNLETLPLSQRLFCGIHKILLDSVRGAKSTPGFFRTGQVHIGKPGSNIEQALYIPPAPQDISGAFSNLENYINSTDRDPLVQLAIIHAQFEIIHPFWDGNGRIGRIILPLFLYSKGILSSPMFYISGYLEKHRERYYECLKGISEDGNWEDWIIFFLTATIEQSRENIDKVNKILALYERNKEIIANITHSQFALQTVDAIFSNPIFSSTQFMNATKTQRKTTFTLLGQLEEAGMIKKIQTGRGRNPNIYIFQELVQITG